jgi:hypothetical protein
MLKTTSLVAAVLISLMTATAGAAPAPAPDSELPGLPDFVGCGKLPAGKAVLKLNLRPRSALGDLINYMTSVSCKPFAPAADVDLTRTVALAGSRTLTPEHLYRLFLAELASAGLTVRPTGKLLEIVARAAGR